MNEKTRVLLADAADEFRHMAAEMIQQEADMEVVGQTGDGEELLRMVRSLRPQVLVMDLVLSGLDGLGALAQLGQERPRVLVLDEATSGLDPAARSEILDILLDFIQDERHSVLLSSHITTDLEQIADTIAYLHHGQLLFAKNKDDLMEEYGILRCSQQDLDRLPPEWIAATCRTAAGCESLVHPRVSVLRALPGVVCDAASIDDIMRLTSKEG